MKQSFTLPVKEAKERLSALSLVFNVSTVLPVLEEALVIINSKEKTVTISITDLENWLETTFTGYPCTGDGIVLVPFMRFFKFVSRAQGQQITVEFEDGKVLLMDGDFVAKVARYNPDNYPKKLMFDEAIPVIKLKDCASFNNAMKIAKVHLSTDDLRPAMTGAYLQVHKEELMVISTDAHRMYMHKVKGNEITFPKEKKGILPLKFVHFIGKYMKTGPMTISMNETNVRATDETYELTSRLIDARFPDWHVVVPECKYEFHMERKKIFAMLKLATPFLNRSTNQIRLQLGKEKVEWDGGDMDFDTTLKFSVPAYNNNMPDAYEAAFNAKFLIEALLVNKDAYVAIKHLGAPTKAIIIDDEMLLMPLMLNN